jgi:hypothetical protein
LKEGVLEELESHFEQGKWDPCITPNTRQTSACISDINIKTWNIKILEKTCEFVYNVTLR